MSRRARPRSTPIGPTFALSHNPTSAESPDDSRRPFPRTGSRPQRSRDTDRRTWRIEHGSSVAVVHPADGPGGVVFSLGLAAAPAVVHAAGYRTTNFVVSAPTPALAKEIGDTAEMWRRSWRSEWLGEVMPPWSKPCPIHARVAPNLGAGGATSFVFDRGEVGQWDMKIQGSRERLLDSVLPHEITHTIFATYFRQPLPRWADEGACTTVEHRSEVAKQERMLIDFLKTGRGIPFSTMFAMKDYPQDVMPLYSQGHSLSQWLIEQRGRREFLAFISDGLKDENWPRAVEQHYGYDNLYRAAELMARLGQAGPAAACTPAIPRSPRSPRTSSRWSSAARARMMTSRRSAHRRRPRRSSRRTCRATALSTRQWPPGPRSSRRRRPPSTPAAACTTRRYRVARSGVEQPRAVFCQLKSNSITSAGSMAERLTSG